MDTFALVTTSLLVLGAVALLLTLTIFRRYFQRRQSCYLYWGTGLLLVFVTLVVEAVFYVGVQPEWLLKTYLFLVAFLVGLLALGSVQLVRVERWRAAYFAFMLAATALAAGIIFLTPVSPNIVIGGIVQGNPSVLDVVSSSLLTVPGAAILVGLSVLSAYRTRRWQTLYVAAGTAVITAAGGLYIAAIPVTLYYAEFVGVFLLFLGFVRVPYLSASRVAVPTMNPSKT